jgi:hypothetical protein
MLILKIEMRSFYFFVVLFFTQSLLCAQPISKNLKLDWLTYSPENQQYSVFTYESRFEPIHIFIDVSEFQTQVIRIVALGPGSIFINEKLVHDAPPESLVSTGIIWRIDSLVDITKSDSIHITLLGFTDIIETLIIPSRSNFGPQNGEDLIKIESRASSKFSNELVLFLFLGSILLLLFKLIKPKGFQNFFDFKAAFSARSRNNIFYETRVLESQSLLFYFFYASLITFFVFYNFQNLMGIPTSSSFSFTMYRMLVVLVIIFFSLPMKNVGLVIFSALFDLGAIKRVHYYDNFRIGLALLILLSLFSIIQKQYFPQFLGFNMLSKALIFSLVFRVGYLFVKLLRITSVKRIYLFSYLCITELIPLFFVIKVLKSTNY